MYYFSLRSILKVYNIYIYFFTSKNIRSRAINQKKKTSLIINQRNNFLKLKKIVTTIIKHQRISHSLSSSEYRNVDVFGE